MYDENNIFAKIIQGSLPTTKVYEDDYILAIHDIAPVAPVHVLVIPKGKYIDYDNFITQASQKEKLHYFDTIAALVQKLELSSYRLINNKGLEAGQTIFHFHTHIISGQTITRLI